MQGIGSAKLEINTGPLPIDKYTSPNWDSQPGIPILPACQYPDGTVRTDWTVQQCVKYILGNQPAVDGVPVNPSNYYRQGARGVRFMFGLGGGTYSTPFDQNGKVQQVWLDALFTFLLDLNAMGYQRVSPTPVTADSWTARMIPVPGRPNEWMYDPAFTRVPCGNRPMYTGGCNAAGDDVKGLIGEYPLRFFKWLNFGHIHGPFCAGQPGCNDGMHDGQGLNQAYDSAAANPYFWGWGYTVGSGPNAEYYGFIGVIDAVLKKVKDAGLIVADLDLMNEMDAGNGTVLARVFFDNLTPDPPHPGTPVYSKLRQKMWDHFWQFGQNWAGRVTASTTLQRVSTTWYTCDSFYTVVDVFPPAQRDSAFLLNLSSLEKFIAGGHFGWPKWVIYVQGLPCESYSMALPEQQCIPGDPKFDECYYGTMPQAPVAQAAPTVTNVHAHICSTDYPGACKHRTDYTTTATNVHNAVYKFITDRGRAAQYVVYGETSMNQALNCADSPPVSARRNVDGFQQSQLGQLHGSYTVFRPWNYLMDSTQCSQAPHPLTPFIPNADNITGTGPPTAVTVEPFESIEHSRTFTFLFSDSDGYTNLTLASVNISQGVNRTNANACWVEYHRAANQLWLRNDAGTGYALPYVTPGQPGTVENSQCILSGQPSSVNNSGRDLRLTLHLSFKSTFTGTKTAFLAASDGSYTTRWGPQGFAGGNPSVVFRANDTAGVYAGEFKLGLPGETPVQYYYSPVGGPLTPGGNNPGAAQNAAGDTVAAVIDNSGALRVNSFRRYSQSWGPAWAIAPGSADWQGTPAVAVAPNGVTYLVVRHKVYNCYYLISYSSGSGFGAWQYLGGVLASDPAVALTPDGNSIFVVGKSDANAIWTGRYNFTSGWQGWVHRGGIVKGQPAVTVDQRGRLHVAVRDGNWPCAWMGVLDEWGVNWSWVYGGGIFHAGLDWDLQIASDAHNKVRLAGLDESRTLFTAEFVADGGWSVWYPGSGVVQQLSGAQVNGRFYAFARDAYNGAWRYKFEDNAWAYLGGLVYGQPATVPR